MVIQQSETLFALYAALNCAGHDDENCPEGMHSVRTEVRLALRAAVREQVALVGEAAQTPGLLHLNHWAMWHSNPPNLKQLRPTKNQIQGLDEALRQFWHDCSIHDLWPAQAEAYRQDAGSLENSALKAAGRLCAFLGRDVVRVLGHVKLVPNLLESHNRAYSVTTIDGSAIISSPIFIPPQFAGTFPDLRGFQVSHELLHSVIHALTPEPMDAPFHDCGCAPAGCSTPAGVYASWPDHVEECLVRAVNIHLWLSESHVEGKQMIEHEARSGRSLVGDIYEHLVAQSAKLPTGGLLTAATIQGIHDWGMGARNA